MSSLKINKIGIKITAIIVNKITLWFNIFSDFSLSLLPRAIAARGEPPIPNKEAKALIIIIIGKQAPKVCPVCEHPQSYFERKANNY